MYSSQLILAALFAFGTSAAFAVVGPEYHEQPENTPVATAPAKPKVKTPPKAPEYESVDRIKGIGQFKFGSKVADYPPGLLQPVSPKAKGKLLRVSPYGDNYLVTNLKGLSWGNIPVSGLIVTFHEDSLIDIQIALRANKVDFYLADRAFKEKYGPNNPETFPVATWNGDRIQVTMVMVGAILSDPGSLDKPALGKVDLFNHAAWTKIEAAQKAQLNDVLNKRYEDAAKTVQANL